MLTVKIDRDNSTDQLFFEAKEVNVMRPGCEGWQEIWGRGADGRRAAILLTAGEHQDETETVFIEQSDDAYIMNSNGKTVQII